VLPIEAAAHEREQQPSVIRQTPRLIGRRSGTGFVGDRDRGSQLRRGFGADRGSAAFTSLERVADRRSGAALIAAWAFAEAIFLPIVPDVGLCLLALAAPRRGMFLFLVVAVASLLGCLALYATAVASPGIAESIVLAVPGIDRSTLEVAASTVASGEPMSLALIGPGTPIKVLTLEWAAGPQTLLPLAVGVVLNRLTRIGPALLAAIAVGWLAPDWLRRHERLVFAGYAIGWLVVYAIYLG
jgi:membrane protein YqaA with SNARE-associated domain